MRSHEIDIRKWWGPFEMTREVHVDSIGELRCVFCGRFPEVGDQVYGIADAIFHFDQQVCMMGGGRGQ